MKLSIINKPVRSRLKCIFHDLTLEVESYIKRTQNYQKDPDNKNTKGNCFTKSQNKHRNIQIRIKNALNAIIMRRRIKKHSKTPNRKKTVKPRC